MGFIHQKLKEFVDLLEPLRLSWKLLFNVSCLEDIFQINPLFLADNPLFDYHVQGEEVLLPGLCFGSQGLDVSTTQDHVDSSQPFV